MTPGRSVLACNSPYDQGGLGQHFAQLVEDARDAGHLHRYLAPAIRPGDEYGSVVPNRTFGLLKYTPIRFSPSWRTYAVCELFDRRTARRLPSADDFIGFTGMSHHCFHAARRSGYDRLKLVATNSHVDNVRRLHARSARDSDLRDTWLHGLQARKIKREYEMADTIYVHSEYVRQSFLDAGVPASKLQRTVLRVAPRFCPPAQRPEDGRFRLVYVGRLEATKGIAVLMEAFDQLDLGALELTLVGGWSTRSVRKYLQPLLSEDDRIVLRPGDPLPALQAADLFVHASYEDGFGYAPMEALASGVPVLATEDTGMKEYIQEGKNGYVVPTGSIPAIVEGIEAVYRRPLAATSSLLPKTYYDTTPASSGPLAFSRTAGPR